MNKEPEVYTIYDLLQREYNVQPMRCLHCNHVGEVEYNTAARDGFCAMCGNWQLEENCNE